MAQLAFEEPFQRADSLTPSRQVEMAFANIALSQDLAVLRSFLAGCLRQNLHIASTSSASYDRLLEVFKPDEGAALEVVSNTDESQSIILTAQTVAQNAVKRWTDIQLDYFAMAGRRYHPTPSARIDRLDPAYNELRRFSWEAIKEGLVDGGRSYHAALADALKFCSKAAGSSVASNDFGLWMEMAWLVWQVENNPSHAEQLLKHSIGINQQQSEWHDCLAHRMLAQLRSDSCDYNGAFELAMYATEKDRSPLSHYDAARYLARLGRADEAMLRLEDVLLQDPVLAVDATVDPDFSSCQEKVSEVVNRIKGQMSNYAQTEVTAWIEEVAWVRQLAVSAEVELEFPPDLEKVDSQILQLLASADLVSCYELVLMCRDKRQCILNAADSQVNWEYNRRRSDVKRADVEIAEAKRTQETKIRNAEIAFNRAKDQATLERDKRMRPNWIACWPVGVGGAAFFGWMWQNLERGLAAFLPSLVAAVAASFVIRSVGAFFEWTRKIALASSIHRAAVREAQDWLTHDLPVLQLEADETARLRDLAEVAVISIQDRRKMIVQPIVQPES